MNAAIQLHRDQFDYDNREPIAINGDEAERIWIENAADRLVDRIDVKVRRSGKPLKTVTCDQFAEALDEFSLERLQAFGVSPSALGRLVWFALLDPVGAKRVAEEIIGEVNAMDVLREIAERLVAPLAADGVIADAENAES